MSNRLSIPRLCCRTIDVKNVLLRILLFFYKKAFFNVFYFLDRFLFSIGKYFYPTKHAKILLNLLNFCIKKLLSDGFNMAGAVHKLRHAFFGQFFPPPPVPLSHIPGPPQSTSHISDPPPR